MQINIIGNVKGCEVRPHWFSAKGEAIKCLQGLENVYYFTITGGADKYFEAYEGQVAHAEDMWKEHGPIIATDMAIAEIRSGRRPTSKPKDQYTKVGRAIKTLLKHKSEHVDILMVDALKSIVHEIGLDKFDTNLRHDLEMAFERKLAE